MVNNYDVVIINYNGEKIIGPCLGSIFNSTQKPVEVIVYDNASSDNSIEIIERDYPSVKLIKGNKNLGFGNANNEAMKLTRSDFILFVNNDVVLDRKCSENLIGGLTANQQIAVLNPLIYKGWDKKRTREIYSYGAVMNKYGFGYSITSLGESVSDLSCFSGACFMGRSKIFKKIQFEKNFFLYYEEPDLSAKILSLGMKIGRVKDAVCYHLESFSSPKNKSAGVCFRQFYAIQNRWYMLGKYWPTVATANASVLNIPHLLYSCLFFIISGKLNYLGLIYLAPKSFFAGRKITSRKERAGNRKWIMNLESTGIVHLLKLKSKVFK